MDPHTAESLDKTKMPAGVKHHWSLFNSVHKAYHAAFSGCRQRAGKKLGQHEFHMTLTKYKKDVCVCVCVVGGWGGWSEKSVNLASYAVWWRMQLAVCTTKVSVCVCVSQTLVSAKLFAAER